MMVESNGVLRSISWQDLCPWTLLFRVFRLSISPQPLLLALFGAMLCSLGWWLIGVVLLSSNSKQDVAVQQFQSDVVYWPDRHSLSSSAIPLSTMDAQTSVPLPVLQLPAPAVHEQPSAAAAADSTAASPAPADLKTNSLGDKSTALATPAVAAPAKLPKSPVVVAETETAPHDGRIVSIWRGIFQRTPIYAMVEPIRRWLVPGVAWDQRGYYFLGSLWSIGVWSWFGGAITRIAAVRLGRDERVGTRESLEFARRKLLSYLGAPLLPLGGILVLMIPLILLGLLMRLNLGVAFAGLLWIPLGLYGFVIALFAVGLLFGWPLMWATISTEGSDAFDGISRSYAYTYQRPLHYLGYFLLAATLGAIGWLLVDLFCETIIRFLYLGVGMGSGPSRVANIREILNAPTATDSMLLRFGATGISLANRMFRGFLTAYAFSYMWSAASGIYLLLRRDADQAEIDDIYLDDDDETSFGLPPLQMDEAGVPSVAAAESESDP